MEHREGWKNLEKDRLDAENQKIAEFAALQAEREGKRQLARVEAEELRTELISKVVPPIYSFKQIHNRSIWSKVYILLTICY